MILDLVFQTDGPVRHHNQEAVTMFGLLMSLVTGALLPPLVAMVIGLRWPVYWKSLATLFIATVVGVGVAFLADGDFSPTRITVVQAVITTYAASTASYGLSNRWGGVTEKITEKVASEGVIPALNTLPAPEPA